MNTFTNSIGGNSSFYVCQTYERLLSGEIKSFSPYFFDKRYRRFRIVTLIKYLIEEKLKISPEDAVDRIDYRLIKEWKLNCLLKYVESYKPIEYEHDRRYVTHLVYYAYPLLPQPTLKEKVIKCYQEVLSDQRNTFPKNYFRDKFGEDRAKICFDYLWQDILQIEFKDIPKVFLVDNETGLNILKQYKLKILVQIIYYCVSDMILNMYPDMNLSEISLK